MALIIFLGKGTHEAYGHIKRKYQEKRKTRDHVRDDRRYPSSSHPQSSQQAEGGRKGYRKLQMNTRRRRDENTHYERDPEDLNINLGIISEAHASVQACASYSAKSIDTYHQLE